MNPAKGKSPAAADRNPAHWILLSLSLALGLGLRAWAAWLNEFPSVDGAHYLDETCQLITRGHLPFSCFPPGWPFLAAIPYVFMDHADPMALLRSAQIANVILGVLAAFLGYLILKRELGSWAALLGLVVLLFLPENIVLAKGDLSEVSFTAGLLGSWLLHQRGRRLSSGLAFGYTYLIRPEAVLAAVGLGLYEFRRTRRLPWRFGLGLAVWILPYLVFIKLASGQWALSSKDVAFDQSLAAHPGLSYLGLILDNLKILSGHLLGLIGLPATMLAIWGAIRRPGLWLVMLLPFLPVPLIINPMVVRFWAPYLAFILLACGLGIADLVAARRLIPQRLGRKARLWILVGSAVAGLGVAAADDVRWVRQNDEAFYGLKDAGIWLRERVDEDTVIAAYKPYTSYWAGCGFLKLPDEEDPAVLLAWARNNGADYLVVNLLVARTLATGLDEFLKVPLRPDLAEHLVPVQTFEYNLVKHNTIIYRIRSGDGR